MPDRRKQSIRQDQPPKRPIPPDESVDEPAGLIEQEGTDIEGAVPQMPNPDIDRGEKEEHAPPAFEE